MINSLDFKSIKRGVKLEFVLRQLAGKADRIRIVPPETAVLPVAQQVLLRGGLDAVPRALDVVGAARSVNQAQ